MPTPLRTAPIMQKSPRHSTESLIHGFRLSLGAKDLIVAPGDTGATARGACSKRSSLKTSYLVCAATSFASAMR